MLCLWETVCQRPFTGQRGIIGWSCVMRDEFVGQVEEDSLSTQGDRSDCVHQFICPSICLSINAYSVPALFRCLARHWV